MAIEKKEIVYWTSCLLYGVVLTGVLLYIRFPAEKLRKYCERFVEDRVAESSCSIAKIQYVLPTQIVFKDVRVQSKSGEQEILFEDPQLSFAPVWKDPLHLLEVESLAYGGNHAARMEINDEGESLDFTDIDIQGVKLDTIPFVNTRFDRKVSGTFDFKGVASGKKDIFQIVAVEGVASVQNGELGFKKSILELDKLELAESTVNISLRKDTIQLSEGKVKNRQLDVSFNGSIALTKPFIGSSLRIKGSMVPLKPLLQEKKQLKIIVATMQKKYKAQSLPYHVGGTIGRPTFTFGN